MCLKPAKKHVIDWMALVKILDIHHLIFPRQSRSGISGALFMAEFGQILPFIIVPRTFFWLISSEICWDIELI